jgi:ABC-type lipoprotein release transport system permease subunit
MILKLANRNIIGNGKRSLINMLILTIVMIGLMWMMSMFYSWINLSRTQMKEWEHAEGMLWHRDYDPFDAFSFEKSLAPISTEQEASISEGKAVPILLTQAVAYPQGRMMPTLLKGIPHSQALLKIPTHSLKDTGDGMTPAVIGTALAKTLKLEEGDILTVRFKDASGVYEALDLHIAEVMRSPVPAVDGGAIWVDLQRLQEAMSAPNTASQIVLSDPSLKDLAGGAWVYKSRKELMKDFNDVLKTELASQSLLFGLFLFLAMLAIFDTQILALFKRRKEIGTLAALGMTEPQIIWLFTVEGLLYLFYATLISTVLGLPLFLWFGIKGWILPENYSDFGMVGFTETIYFKYPLWLVLLLLGVMFFTTALASWLPTLRIARLKPTEALRGKGF